MIAWLCYKESIMKKIFALLFGLAITLPSGAQGRIPITVSDIEANNGHITYTRNVYLPLANDTIHMQTRCDYICSQKKEAILWGEAMYIGSGKTIDYTSLMDKSRLRKYQPVTQEDYEVIQQIIPYCGN